jgi:hypothetical protein
VSRRQLNTPSWFFVALDYLNFAYRNKTVGPSLLSLKHGNLTPPPRKQRNRPTPPKKSIFPAFNIRPHPHLPTLSCLFAPRREVSHVHHKVLRTDKEVYCVSILPDEQNLQIPSVVVVVSQPYKGKGECRRGRNDMVVETRYAWDGSQTLNAGGSRFRTWHGRGSTTMEDGKNGLFTMFFFWVKGFLHPEPSLSFRRCYDVVIGHIVPLHTACF